VRVALFILGGAVGMILAMGGFRLLAEWLGDTFGWKGPVVMAGASFTVMGGALGYALYKANQARRP